MKGNLEYDLLTDNYLNTEILESQHFFGYRNKFCLDWFEMI